MTTTPDAEIARIITSDLPEPGEAVAEALDLGEREHEADQPL